MHKVGRFDPAQLRPHPVFDGHAIGLSWLPFIDHASDSVHAAYGVMELAPDGETEVTTHAYEKALFVTGGELEISRDGAIYRLSEGDYILVPTAVPHALRNRAPAPARFVAMAAPQPKPPGGWRDTWFAGPADWTRQAAAPDLRDPRNRMLGHYDPAAAPPAATVHSQLHGFALQMLMDANFGAVHFNMFVVNFPDGGLCDHHDHPFEEAYFILDGKVDITFDGKDYTLEAGDYAWTGVGAQHAFFPATGQPVRWLEVQMPQPPAMGGMRWYAQWDYLDTVLRF